VLLDKGFDAEKQCPNQFSRKKQFFQGLNSLADLTPHRLE